MATSIKLKSDIKKIEAAIKSKATPKSLVSKLETQLDKLKSDLASLSSAKPKKGVTKTKVLSSLQKLKAKVKSTKSLSGYKRSGIDIEKDADVPALPLGRRTAKTTGNTYYEYRLNRADVKQPPKRYPKLADGGVMAKGGKITDKQMQRLDSGFEFIIYTDLPRQYGQYHISISKEKGDVVYTVKSGHVASSKKVKTFTSEKDAFDYLTNKFGVKVSRKKMDYADGGMMARGGMVVTSIKEIPNFKQRLEEGKITYRGLGMGKKSDDFYDLAGENGKSIKVDGKEYYITDTEFDSFSRGSDGKLRIRFDAPYKKSYDDGGMMDYDGDTTQEENYAYTEIYYNPNKKIGKPSNKSSFKHAYTVDIDGKVYSMSGTIGSNSESIFEGYIDDYSPQEIKSFGEKIMFYDAPKELVAQIHKVKGYKDGGYMAMGGITEHGLEIGDKIYDSDNDNELIFVENDGIDYEINLQNGKRYRMGHSEERKDNYGKGGRTTSAINRDRAYKSNQPWEQNYARKSRPKNPKYKSSSDFFEEGGEMHRLFEDGEA